MQGRALQRSPCCSLATTSCTTLFRLPHPLGEETSLPKPCVNAHARTAEVPFQHRESVPTPKVSLQHRRGGAVQAPMGVAVPTRMGQCPAPTMDSALAGSHQHPVNQSISQPTRQPVNQSVNEGIAQWTKKSLFQSVTKSPRQINNQPRIHSFRESIVQRSQTGSMVGRIGD